MSLLGPRHSYVSGLAISNRSEPEAQGVLGSVVFLVKTLDNRRLQSCTDADWDLVPAASFAVRGKCACTTLRSLLQGPRSDPLQVICPKKFELLRWASLLELQLKKALLKRVRPGTRWARTPGGVGLISEGFLQEVALQNIYAISSVPPCLLPCAL